MAAGFFTVLILERIVLNCREMGGSVEERAPLMSDNRNGHGHGHGTSPDLEGSGHHVHVDFQAHSSFRSFMLFLSLSLHSVFEGLAIGLQSTDSKVRRQKSTSPDVKRVMCGPLLYKKQEAASSSKSRGRWKCRYNINPKLSNLQCPGVRHHRFTQEVLFPCHNGSEPSPVYSGASIRRTSFQHIPRMLDHINTKNAHLKLSRDLLNLLRVAQNTEPRVSGAAQGM